MNTREKNCYDERIRRVCDYISQNLDEHLTLERLSEVAAFSKYHFHRLFAACTGQSLMNFILLARMRRASFRLAFEPGYRITDIAFEAGFNSSEAFSRAFKRLFEQTPSQFRQSPEWSEWHKKFEFDLPTSGTDTMNVQIVDFQETPVALIEHRGAPERVYETAARFIAWRKSSGLSPVETSKTYGIPHGDPNRVDPDEFRFDICGSIDVAVPENQYGVRAATIPGGRCAVVCHKGSHDTLDECVYRLYREWLPESGETLRDYPCFFHYLNFVHEVNECDLVTYVYLPLNEHR